MLLSLTRVVALTFSILLSPVAAFAIDYSSYHQFSEVEQALKQAAARPNAKLLTIGSSASGRPIYVLRISGAADADATQAVFVAANVAGYHNAGTEAALDLIEKLQRDDSKKLLERTTFYIAPALNPDAHDAMFGKVRRVRSGNGDAIDLDVDGLVGEDGFEDLNGDGRITWMRMPDAHGEWLAHPDDARVMVRADALKGRVGAFRLEREGNDDDRDGRYNENPADGISVDMNFPKAFPHPKPEAGPWPTRAPESHAVVRFITQRPNIALAIVYGPANNLLEIPRAIESGADLGTQRFKIPPQAAGTFGFDPEEEYTIDEVWEVAKDVPFVVQNNLTKDDIAQFLGAGAAIKLDDADQKLLEQLAKDYKERLKNASLDAERPAEQYSKGGLTPWLYYHQGLLALELDVWGIPKGKKDEAEESTDAPLTLKELEGMSNDEFLALKEERIAEFLKSIKAPSQFTAAAIIERVKGGQLTPKVMAQMVKQSGAVPAADEGDDDDATKRAREVLAWVDANAPEVVTPWKTVTLANGRTAEVGGLDPFARYAPPTSQLTPAVDLHNRYVLDLASKLGRVEIASLETEDLGGGVYRVRAVAANRGALPTHSAMAARTKNLLPVRLRIVTGGGVDLITGYDTVTAERLDAATGTIEGEWLVRASKGADIRVEVITPSAGTATRSVAAGKGVQS